MSSKQLTVAIVWHACSKLQAFSCVTVQLIVCQIGGSLSGLLAARMLQCHAGPWCCITVFERSCNPSSHHGLSLDIVAANLVRQYCMIRSMKNKDRVHFRASAEIQRESLPQIETTSYNELIRGLRSGLECFTHGHGANVTYRAECPVTALSKIKDKVLITYEVNGSSTEELLVDLVIAADGAYSQSRTMVLGDKAVAPTPTNYVAWRGLLDLNITPEGTKGSIFKGDIGFLNFRNSYIIL